MLQALSLILANQVFGRTFANLSETIRGLVLLVYYTLEDVRYLKVEELQGWCI
jgi:hypothetical protein